jgi:hypothetical protein
MYGDIIAWFYKTLAGINPDPQSPGFKHFILKPQVLGNVQWAKGTYNSVHGLIVSDWYLKDRHFNLTVVVPPNTTATIHLPVSNRDGIRESGHTLDKATGINKVATEGTLTIVVVGSGTYNFSMPFPEN